MSDDTVDDLHAAEDMASSLAAVLEELLDLTRDTLVDNALTSRLASLDGAERVEQYRKARAVAVARVQEQADYCRPTCGAEGDADSDACTDDTCGCPCGHTDA